MRLLNAKKTDIEKRKTIRENEGTVLWQYANSFKGEHIQPAQLLQFMGSYVTHSNKVAAAVRANVSIVLNISLTHLIS